MWLLALLAGPAHAHLEVLIYGPTETYEAAAVKDLGGVATVWDEATWKAAKASDFERFHVIVVGDAGCSGATASELKTLHDTRATWGPVVKGNIVVGGINPGCHASTEPAAEELFINLASYAGDGGGVPGLLVLGDHGSRDLDFLDAWGSFDVETRADDTVTLVSKSHRLWSMYYVLSGTDLSGWGDSSAAYVKSWPSDWYPLARNSKGEAVLVTFDDCDGDFDTYLDGRCGGTDCDDDDSLVKPGATEYCNGYDDDCDKAIDEDDAADTRTFYRDADSDSWGDGTSWLVKCYAPAGYVSKKGDCDDGRAASFPGAPEYCNGYDDDCDSLVDEIDALDATTFWFDYDADGYGDPARSTPACKAPSGWVGNDDDCDDTDFRSYPGATEVPYDGTDQDCDGSDLCDVDEDGYDHPTCGGKDCDDTDDARHPGATETWYDGVDTDCDGWSDYDADKDGDDSELYGGTDCDDGDPTVYAGAPELSDGKDNDCNGFAEDDDDDGDGLTSEDELVLGTDPDDGDWDDDGLSDGEEAGLDLESPIDSDDDGLADVFDDDDDDDGIPTLDEIGDHDWTDPTSEPDDTDGDGLPDHLDDDSDGDGLSDTFEGTVDTDGDGVPDFKDVDSDGDGLPDALEAATDTDSDGLPDRLDPDDDGDGLSTLEEGTGDTDGDLIPDYLDLDSDGDGHADALEGPADTDGDGLRDSLDLDSDDDGLPDRDESNADADGDDWPDRIDDDDDGDGLPTRVEAPDATPVDHDEDGVPDHLDPDSDDDGFGDGVEGLVDSDGDGLRDSLDPDSEDDGVPDALELNGDTDGDGLVDRLDDDDDGDGLRSLFEGSIDTDGDGVPDHRDPDSDGDGVLDLTEGYRDDDCDQLRNYVDADDSDGPCVAPDPWPDIVVPGHTDPEPPGTGCATTGVPVSLAPLLLFLPLWVRRRRAPISEPS